MAISGLFRKIRCPRHFLLTPGKEAFVREINPLYRKLPKWAFKKFNLKETRIKRDRHGNKIVNYKNYYQPLVTAAWAIEHVYDPLNWICQNQCKRRCFEGMGSVNTRAIKRLQGNR